MRLKLPIKTKKAKIYFCFTVFGILILAIPVFIFLFPRREALPLKYYLPRETVFYLEIDNNSLPQKAKGVYQSDYYKGIFALRQEQEEIWGPYFNRLQKIILFKVANDLSADNFLLYFSVLPDKSYLSQLQVAQPDYSFELIGKNILKINSPVAATLALSNQWLYPADLFTDAEISFYYQHKSKWPPLLFFWEDYLDLLLLEESQDVFVSISQNGRQIDINQNIQNIDKGHFSSLTAIDGFDFGAGFLTLDQPEKEKNPLVFFIKQIFTALPYNTLADQNIADILLAKKVVFVKDDNWLIVSTINSNLDVLKFLNVFQSKEIPKTLADGTAYYELVADSAQPFFEQELNGYKYRKIGDLYLLDKDQYYYLTNNQDFIEELITKPVFLGDLLGCGKTDYLLIKDFLWLKTDKLKDNLTIKKDLIAENIDYFKAFSYYFSGFSGLRICF